MLAVIIAYYAIAFGFLICASYPTRLEPHRLAFKVLTSAGFLALAIWFAFSSGNWWFFARVAPAFGLCFVGDVFMALTDNASRRGQWSNSLFLAGVGSFGLGHVGFLIALLAVAPFNWLDCILPAIMLVITIILTGMPKMNLGKMRPFTYVYAVLVSWLLSKSLVWLITAGISTAPLLATIGSLLFLISDMLLLFIYFFEHVAKPTRFFNLFTYYLAMGLLAALIAYV